MRVVTLNVAHGRKDGRNQMLLKEETIRSNLEELALVLNRAEADVVALQEADAISAWSGKFDHVEWLSEKSIYGCSFHGIHASKRIYDFGTALLSRYPFEGSFAHSFKPSKPTTTKGFSVAALQYLAGLLNLSVYEPHANGLSTYGAKGARLDWILISEELSFENYAVFPDVVSDHFAVAANLVLRKQP